MSHDHATETTTISSTGTEIQANGSMPSDEFRDQADAAEVEATTQAAQQAADRTEPMIFRVGAAGERDQVTRAISKIDGYRDNLINGIEVGAIDTGVLAQNASATGVLSDLLTSTGEQDRTLSDFQAATHQARFDAARLASQLALVQKQNPTLDGDVIDAWGGQKELEANTKKVSTDGGGAPHWSAMQSNHSEMEHWVNEAAAQQIVATGAQTDASTALSNIEAGVPTREKKTVEGSEVLKTTAALKQLVGKVIGLATKAFKADAGTEAATALAGVGIDTMFSRELAKLEALTGESDQKQQHGGARMQVTQLRSSLSVWTAAILRTNEAQEQVQRFKMNMRDSTRQFAGAAENHGEFAVAMIASLYAEADTLVQQLTLAIGLGQAEDAAGGAATKDAEDINRVGNALDPIGHGVRYYEPIRAYTRGQLTYTASLRKISIGRDGLGGTEGAKGVNPVVSMTLQELRQMKATVSVSRDRLGSVLGFSRRAAQKASNDK